MRPWEYRPDRLKETSKRLITSWLRNITLINLMEIKRLRKSSRLSMLPTKCWKMLIRDKYMTNCARQTGILIIKTTVVLPNNNNTIIKVEIRGLSLHHHRMGISTKVRKPRKTSISTIRVMNRVKRKLKTFSKIIGKISGTVQAWTVKRIRRARVRTFIGRRQSESNESTKEEVAMQVLLKTNSGKTAEDSRIAAINILKVKIHSSRRKGHIVKRSRKKHKKMSFTDNITMNTTSSRVSNTNKGKPKKEKDQVTTKTATSISLNKRGSATNLSPRPIPNMNPKMIPCSTILTEVTTSGT